MAAKNLDDLAESFSMFDNWEDRYRYLIDLGQRLCPMPAELKTDERLVRGCTSRVWIDSDIRKEDGVDVLRFQADSDAQIVKGLIYILVLAYQGIPASDIAGVDIEGAFERLGLSGHLSPNRRNGFFAMVEHIRKQGGNA